MRCFSRRLCTTTLITFFLPLSVLSPSQGQAASARGDGDGDGFRSTKYGGLDCDDADALIHPGAAESCDGRDQDCDGLIDENVGSTFYLDADRDTFGASSSTLKGCSTPDGYSSLTGDCDDSDAAVHPGALERLDGRDEDCNGRIDDPQSLDPMLEVLGVDVESARILGDLNGDAYADLLVLAGSARIYLGGRDLKSLGESLPAVEMPLDSCDGSMLTFSPLGDSDADGYDDFTLLCAYEAAPGANRLLVFYGAEDLSSLSIDSPDAMLISRDAREAITAVAPSGGDLNNDGYSDLVFACADSSNVAEKGGQVGIFLGSPGRLRLEQTILDASLRIDGRSGQHLGSDLDIVGDLDGDGQLELAVQEAREDGTSRLYLFAELWDYSGSVPSGEWSTMFYDDTLRARLSPRYVGDLTGDGLDDLVFHDDYTLYIVRSEVQRGTYLNGVSMNISSLGAQSVTYAKSEPEFYHHIDPKAAGDVNGDGIEDLLVGVWSGSNMSPESQGQLELILGIPFADSVGWPESSAFLIETPEEEAGRLGMPGTFGANGDLNGDGLADFVAGEYHSQEGALASVAVVTGR